jgi:hypothetical protein
MNAKLSVAVVVTFVGAAVQAQQTRKPTDPPLELPTLTQPEVVPTRAVAPTAGPASAPEAKFNSEAAKAFAAKIQPILTNRCADCHAHKDHAGGFKLKWIEPGLNDPQSADANLRAVARWLTPTAPHDSPLLKYAVTPHGKAAEAPLPKRHAAYEKFELWVHWACGPDGSAAPTAVSPPRAATLLVPVQQAVAIQPATVPPAVVTAGFATAPTGPMTDSKPNPNDPFDPAAFNRIAHPSRR